VRDKREILNLHFTTTGCGPDLVLLHGWALSSCVFADLLPRLETRWRVILVDLPGHGASPANIDMRNLDAVCAALQFVAPAPAAYIGWSMGGLIALAHAVRHPECVTRLLLVASQPRFMRAPDWPHGLAAEALDTLQTDLGINPKTAIARFLSLQVQGAESRQRTLRRLHAILRAAPPVPTALRASLGLLRDTDLRTALPMLLRPVRLILGERDRLISTRAGAAIMRLSRDARCEIIQGAGHVPFLSHADAFARALYMYLDD
jgi:pimeloyl-[acyl-carrier protein] methyl ester esterase